MTKNREESFIGETTYKIYEKIKELGKSTCSVGGVIPPKEKHEWKKLRNRLEKYGVNINKGGLIFVIKWTNMLMDTTCPIAEEIDVHPIGFTDEMISKCTEIIKNMDYTEWIEKSQNFKKDIVNKTEDKLKTDIILAGKITK